MSITDELTNRAVQLCRNGSQLPIPSHSDKFQSHSHASQTFVPISIIFPYRIDIPSPSHSHLPYINDYMEQFMEIVIILPFIRHSYRFSNTNLQQNF